jgi:hypothetical protein
MPDATGALTPTDNDTIQRWWDQHWKAPVICPVCKTTDWTIAPHVVNFQRHADDASVPNTTSYPHIVVTCKNCAHSMLFNAVQIGVSPSRSVSSLTNALLGSPMGSLFGALAPESPFGYLAPPPGALSSLLKKDK